MEICDEKRLEIIFLKILQRLITATLIGQDLKDLPVIRLCQINPTK